MSLHTSSVGRARVGRARAPANHWRWPMHRLTTCAQPDIDAHNTIAHKPRGHRAPLRLPHVLEHGAWIYALARQGIVAQHAVMPSLVDGAKERPPPWSRKGRARLLPAGKFLFPEVDFRDESLLRTIGERPARTLLICKVSQLVTHKVSFYNRARPVRPKCCTKLGSDPGQIYTPHILLCRARFPK